MTPWEELADHFDDLDPDAEVYSAITEQLDTPCIVLMPDDPWMEPTSFQYDQERYRAISVVKVSDGDSAQSKLHQLVHFIRQSLPNGWDFESASAPQQTDHQGITYIAVDTRLTFRDCSHTGEES